MRVDGRLTIPRLQAIKMADPVADLLVQIASDILAGASNFLPDTAPRPIKQTLVQTHRRHVDFVAAMELDKILSRIFPDDDEKRRMIRSHRPRSVAAALISASIWHCWREGFDAPEAAIARLPSLVAQLRELVSMGKIQGTILVGLSATLPAGTSLKTPYGLLRSRGPTDAVILRDMLNGERIPDGGSILESQVDLSWGVRPGEAGTVRVPSLDELPWLVVCLAILLGLEDENQRPVTPWAVTQINPLSYGIWGGASCNTMASWGTSVRADQLSLVESFLNNRRIAEFPEVAIRRFLSSCSRRGEHLDSFIDAVICWESLFAGADSAELSYRVSMNMAAISSDQAEVRIATQQRVKELYSLRSKIIHGAKHLEQGEAHALRKESHALSINALRRLIVQHPQLISAKSQSFINFLLRPTAT